MFSKESIIDNIKVFLPALIIALFLNAFVFNVTKVKGDSMEPSFQNGNRLIVSKIYDKDNSESYNREDVIVFKAKDKDANYIKRVVGLPGDRVKIENGLLYINGKRYHENYIEDNIVSESIDVGSEVEVGADELFILGDNRHYGKSYDSRKFGNIKLSSIVGKVKVRVFPLNKLEYYE